MNQSHLIHLRLIFLSLIVFCGMRWFAVNRSFMFNLSE